MLLAKINKSQNTEIGKTPKKENNLLYSTFKLDDIPVKLMINKHQHLLGAKTKIKNTTIHISFCFSLLTRSWDIWLYVIQWENYIVISFIFNSNVFIFSFFVYK